MLMSNLRGNFEIHNIKLDEFDIRTVYDWNKYLYICYTISLDKIRREIKIDVKGTILYRDQQMM